ncbi:MAG: DUF5785 family protein [Halanaeroarchaeum sp.]
MVDASTSDWPHDPDGEKGSEGMRKFDMAVLSKMVEEDEFPIETDAFVEEYGDWPVRMNHDSVVSVAEIFEHVPEEEIENKVEFHRAVGRAVGDAGLWDYMPDVEPA